MNATEDTGAVEDNDTKTGVGIERDTSPLRRPVADDAGTAQVGRGIRETALYAAARLAVAGKGELAMLRRIPLKGYGDLPELFWSIIQAKNVEERDEIFWADVLSMMASVPNGEDRIGRSMAIHGIGAKRVERWLRLDREEARVECRKLLKRLPGVSWGPLANSLYWWGEDERRAVARDYFSIISKENKEPKE